MARSVNYLYNAKVVYYIDTSEWGYVEEDVLECPECGCELYDYETEYEDGDECSCCTEGKFKLKTKERYDEYIAEINFEDFKSEVTTELQDICTEIDEWEGNEVHILWEGDYTNVAISEYNGLLSLSVAQKDDIFDYCEEDEEVKIQELADKETEKIVKLLEKFGEYKKIGCFSNGECIYEKV